MMETVQGQEAIGLRDVGYRIGGKTILAGVSLSVRVGERISIIGPNGAGKTTLLKCINRILHGYSGSIALLGRSQAAYSPRELARLVGYVPQAEERHAPFTVRELVMMGRYPYLSPFTTVSTTDDAAVTRALEITGTAPFAERTLGTLSGGECQKVFIAAALAQEARILLLDEPTTFLDPHHQADIFAILQRINRERGVTLVVVTHDVNGAALSSDRLVALRAGEIMACGTPEAIMTDAVLGALYGKSFLFVPHPVTGRSLLVPEGGGAA